jgi:MoaA/NifB/PqqE/SkfB family radical SAM enzyme
VSLEIDPSGWVYTCCANQLYPLGRIGRDRLADLWAGPRSQVLREALERWDLSVGCGMCQWHLEHGRMDPDAAVYDEYPLESRDPPGPAAMTFALSNRCNLGCVMCTPELSSTLRHRAGLPPLASPFDDAFYEDVAAFLPGLRYAKFLGGEPFLIPEHHRVWDLMDEVGGPPRMQVTTNGTVWNERVAWLLERFRFDVTISIDGATAPTYEAIRVGASFDQVRTNVERFRAACAAAGTELRLCFCLMPQNAHELVDLVRWTDRLGAALSVNVVTDLGLALHDLPVAELEAVRSRWASQEAQGPLGRNEGVWRTQVAQLDLVIDERRRGVPPPARQAIEADPSLLAPPAPEGTRAGHTPEQAAEALGAERARLAAWAEGGQVAELRCDDAGIVAAVVEPHARLGIDAALIGLPIERVLGAMVEADGRRAWAMGADQTAARQVRTVVLAATHPVRGTTGSVVRVVTVPQPGGSVTLVAEDRSYDAPVPVSIGPARTPAR